MELDQSKKSVEAIEKRFADEKAILIKLHSEREDALKSESSTAQSQLRNREAELRSEMGKLIDNFQVKEEVSI